MSAVKTMQALAYKSFGGHEAIIRTTLPIPSPSPTQALLRVRAISLNAGDLHLLSGKPFLMRLATSQLFSPRPNARPGLDVCGKIEAFGDVTAATARGLSVGDDVIAQVDLPTGGCSAEFVCVPLALLVKQPAGSTVEEAAGLPCAAVTAWKGVKDLAHVQPGQRVLINGASGGVGTFALQMAVALGGEVTAVCSTRNAAQARALGATTVIDYTRDDFTVLPDTAPKYDVVFDLVGNRDLAECLRILSPDGVYVSAGGDPNTFVSRMRGLMWTKMTGGAGKRRLEVLLSLQDPEKLEEVRALVEEGKVKTVIDRTYGFDEAVEAVKYFEEGKATGKVIVKM
ncbi:hypothetical protein HDU96_001100 [Phlyctochytrium bullatum]|nr:hypothetical protein HDU96_001100 [Phlyctochytrium bullatum]